MKKDTKDDFIKKAINVHGFIYDYSRVVYEKSNICVVIICKSHGEFQQRPNNHLNGTGCTKCSKNNFINPLRNTTETFIERSKDKHGDKYDYSKSVYGKNSYDKITIICKKHGEFQQIPNNHLRGAGCIKCRIENQTDNKRGTSEKFIEQSKQIHGDRYDYSKSIYGNSNRDKVCIICKIHGDFLQHSYQHISGAGCPDCGGSKKSNTTEFIKRSINQHKNENNEQLFDYSNVIYKNAREKVIIKCKKHNIDFLETPDCHNYTTGCYICKKGKQYSKLQILWLNFIQKIYNINIQHAENGGEYTIQNSK